MVDISGNWPLELVPGSNIPVNGPILARHTGSEEGPSVVDGSGIPDDNQFSGKTSLLDYRW